MAVPKEESVIRIISTGQHVILYAEIAHSTCQLGHAVPLGFQDQQIPLLSFDLPMNTLNALTYSYEQW